MILTDSWSLGGGTYSYFNNELIHMDDIELMNATFGSSG